MHCPQAAPTFFICILLSCRTSANCSIRASMPQNTCITQQFSGSKRLLLCTAHIRFRRLPSVATIMLLVHFGACTHNKAMYVCLSEKSSHLQQSAARRRCWCTTAFMTSSNRTAVSTALLIMASAAGTFESTQATSCHTIRHMLACMSHATHKEQRTQSQL